MNPKTRVLWIADDFVFERGPCGSLRGYFGEAAEVMRLVLRYSTGIDRYREAASAPMSCYADSPSSR